MAYEISTFYSLLENLDGREYIESYISYNVALISATLKPSVTLTIKKDGVSNKLYHLWKEHGEKCLENISMKSVLLREGPNYEIILIYSEELLRKFINKEDNKEFLELLGYDLNQSMDVVLEGLVKAYEIHKCPHELGVFLGYPIEDVRAFMECSREKCLCCGYWKVYNNEEKAKKVFNLFDSIKALTIKNIILGKKAQELNWFLQSQFSKEQHLVLL